MSLSFAVIVAGYDAGISQTLDQVFIKGIASHHKAVVHNELLSDFIEGKQESNVIVLVNSVKGNSAGVKSLQSDVAKEVVQAAAAISSNAVIGQLDVNQIKVTRQFSYLNGFAATVTLQGLEQLLNHPKVVSVEKNKILHEYLAQGVPVMNATAVRRIYSGSGIAIAVTDTGIDTAHPYLGNGGNPIFNSKVIGGYDTGDDDSDPRPSLITGRAHGTAVAGIAAGNTGAVGDYIGGVAPDAKLYAIKISYGDTGYATSDAMIAAWEWAITHQNDDPLNPILVINTSFGGGSYSSTCDTDTPSMTSAAANAVSAGITIFAASGNDGYCSSMGWPACISNVISVGAVYDADIGSKYWCVDSASCATKSSTGGCPTGWFASDLSTAADQVTVYSNSASFLDLLAPSNNAYTTDITGAGGYASNNYTTLFGGTSAASPYAAGAAAVLQHAAKEKTGSYLTPEQVKQYLQVTGDSVTDSKVAITKPRVNVGNANNLIVIDNQTYIPIKLPNGKMGLIPF